MENILEELTNDSAESWMEKTDAAINLCAEKNVPAEIVFALLSYLASKYKPDDLNWQLDSALATIDVIAKDKYGRVENLEQLVDILGRQNDKLMDFKISNNAIKTTLKQLKDAVWDADHERQGKIIMNLVSMSDDD